jgi:preprotein translocase subunit SecG
MNNNIELPKMVDEDKVSLWNKLTKYLSTKDSKEIINLIIKVALIIIVILLFKFPFDLLKDMGTNVLTMFGISLTDNILNIWNAIINIIYGIIGIITFYKVCKERILNIK